MAEQNGVRHLHMPCFLASKGGKHISLYVAPHVQLRHSVMIIAYHLQLQKRMRQSHRLSTFIIGLWL